MTTSTSPARPSVSDDDVEFVFLGTGTSSSVPHVDCLTRPPEATPCLACLSTLKPEGKKNRRRNTSGVFRVKGKDGKKKTIVVDVGKTFQAAALEWFPKYGLRRIDAVLITHAHADAMNGLDDLRGWTLNSAIQPFIDVYVSQSTFTEVMRSFPYLVAKEFASGGGDVPDFHWHVIEDKVPFEIGDTGIQITPFSVHHGRIFSALPPAAFLPTPCTTAEPSPAVSGAATPVSQDKPEKIQPYLCFGFKIQESIVYISDVSHVPDDVWLLLQNPSESSQSRRLPVLVLDRLRLHSHTSHYGVKDSLATARRLGASRTYLTGFSHEIAHDEWVAIDEVAGGKQIDLDRATKNVSRGVKLLDGGDPIWMRPGFDGLRVFVSADGRVWDEGYD